MRDGVAARAWRSHACAGGRPVCRALVLNLGGAVTGARRSLSMLLAPRPGGLVLGHLIGVGSFGRVSMRASGHGR